MGNKTEETITVAVTLNAPLEKVWKHWTDPAHITQWNFAADSWHCPAASNELKTGGIFSWRMEAKDGSMGFDYAGTYENVEDLKSISKKLGDGRMVYILFTEQGDTTTLTETFEPETVNPLEMQQTGWQAILNNFKKQVENQLKLDRDFNSLALILLLFFYQFNGLI